MVDCKFTLFQESLMWCRLLCSHLNQYRQNILAHSDNPEFRTNRSHFSGFSVSFSMVIDFISFCWPEDDWWSVEGIFRVQSNPINLNFCHKFIVGVKWCPLGMIISFNSDQSYPPHPPWLWMVIHKFVEFFFFRYNFPSHITNLWEWRLIITNTSYKTW